MAGGSCLWEGPGKAAEARSRSCVSASVLEATPEGGRGRTLDLIPRTWGIRAKVLSIGGTGSNVCFLKNCEL